MRPTTSSRRRVAARAVAALLAAALLGAPSPASAGDPQGSNAQGAALLGAVQDGSKGCGDLSSGDFAAIGEYTMGRMIGSTQGHEAMDSFMSTMMGTGSERRVHEAMGRRFSGCGGGQLPAGFGRMMGAVNAMGMMGGGMMGAASQGGRPYGGPASMMGDYTSGGGANANDDDGPSAAAMLGMMAVLIGAVALAALWLGPRRRPAGPLKTLEQRYARGELTAEEYQDRKRLLEGVDRA